ncbi:uncharacterized protein LOC143513050 isoform X4 [Brachyhypopomus gauderio]|uniref:uncharacterized protein LOC143513050 isoform X4 n=1 Tax=Brachyhypopomus gauderio TaxID=698409 RepID=UPI004043259C
MRNPTYILFLALWWCPDWTTSNTTPSPEPYWRRYWGTTPEPYWRRHWGPTVPSYWRRYWGISPDWMTSNTTPSPNTVTHPSFVPSPEPYWRRNWRTNKESYWRERYWETTPEPYRRRYWGTTPEPYWRRNWRTNKEFYWRERYWKNTPEPYWRRYWGTTPEPYWRRYWGTTSEPDWKRRYWGTTAPIENPDIPHPTVEIYQQETSRENVVVICQFGMKTSHSSFELSIRNGEKAHVLRDPTCTEEAVCFFQFKVTQPTSFICVHKVTKHQGHIRHISDPYTFYNPDVSHISGFPFYTGFAFFIGVVLIIMVITVTVVTFRGRQNVKNVQKGVYEDM